MKSTTSIRSILTTAIATFALTGVARPASAQAQAPDATGFGPFATMTGEYKFPATTDPDVLALRPTELWAQVWTPSPFTGTYPVLIFLHGNHATCGYGSDPRIDSSVQYTFSGTCPPNFVVTPNHLGYAYLAEQLASWGYVVVSVNANRGINAAGGSSDDLGLNIARGRLLLKHMQRLSEWNRNGGSPPSLGVELRGRLDFSHTGLLGHSRGGEGVRAAYNLYRDMGSLWPARIGPVSFEGIFEIGPVDGQTSRLFDVNGTAWNLLLAMCDGDVSNLQGIRVFDRAMLLRGETPARMKSTFTVWGTNHNYYNTEWQTSDSTGCAGHDPLWSTTIGSEDQRTTGLVAAMAFFRGNVGAAADRTFDQNFDPLFMLPDIIAFLTRVDRGYSDSPSSVVERVIDDFDRATGLSSSGAANESSGITIANGQVPNHNAMDPYGRAGTQRAAAISWTRSSSGAFFQANWTGAGAGMDASSARTLQIRLSRQCAEPPATQSCAATNPRNPSPSTNFSVRLAMADGTLSDPVAIEWYADLTGPVGGLFSDGTLNLHPILQTARIPLADFSSADLTRLRGVRLTFDGTATGAIFVGNLRLSNLPAPGASGAGAPNQGGQAGNLARRAPNGGAVMGNNPSGTIVDGNAVVIRNVESAVNGAGPAPAVELEVTSAQAFPVRDELAVLRIGALAFAQSRYPESGDTRTLIFTVPADELAAANEGDEIFVQYGVGASDAKWSFGPLDRSALNR